LGVFDYDELGDMDFIGRVGIDVADLEFNTTYSLHYDLQNPSRKEANNGSIFVRLCIDCPDGRAMIFSALTFPAPVWINVKTAKENDMILHTVYGYGESPGYSLDTICSQITELSSYQIILYYIYESAPSVLLWKNHFDVSIPVPCKCADSSKDKTFFRKYFKTIQVNIPLHSMIAFIAGITLIEDVGLIVPYFFGSIAWLLLAVLEYRNDNPSPWSKCKTFEHFLSILLFGEEVHFIPTNIKPHENEKESIAYLAELEKRRLEVEEETKKANEEYIKLQEEANKNSAQLEKFQVDIATKTSSFVPFKSYLYPIQMQLESLCWFLRCLRSVVLWEECYYSFWITLTSTVLAIVSYFIPWNWIFLWTSRIVVWLVLGPWMKLVDIFYFEKLKRCTEEERELKKHEDNKERKRIFYQTLKYRKIKHEEAIKLKDMKAIMFGKFCVQVPILSDQSNETPLAKSSAKYIGRKHSLTPAEYNVTHVEGQQLVGTMIPHRVEKTEMNDGKFSFMEKMKIAFLGSDSSGELEPLIN